MMIHKAYKFRIYPNQEQQILIAKTIGCSRFVFNRFLSEWCLWQDKRTYNCSPKVHNSASSLG